MEDRFELGADATQQRMLREKGSPVTKRDWDRYPFMFALPQGDEVHWQGKKILDVGSGIKSETPDWLFPGATICAIDPEFKDNGGASFTRIPINTAHEKRIGIAQEIPYDDNSFHHVISSHAVPQHIFPYDMPKSISEMLRVIRPDGDIRLAPCIDRDLPMEALLEAKIEVDFNRQKDQRGLSVICFSEKVRGEKDPLIQLWRKAEAWKKFHQLVVPGDPIRADFDTMDYARSNFSKLQ